MAVVDSSASLVSISDKWRTRANSTGLYVTLDKMNGWGLTAPSDAVTNDTAETIFAISASELVGTISASTLRAGSRVLARGLVNATATNSTDTLQIQVYLSPSSTSVASADLIGDSGAVDVADDDVIDFEVEVQFRTVGAAGTAFARSKFAIGVLGTANYFTSTLTSAGSAVEATALVTTAAQFIVVTATWSVADPGNSCLMEMFSGEFKCLDGVDAT